MFVGHYGVAFAVKTERNKIPLWVLFVAVQFLDYIWAIFILLGIEKLRVVRGFTAGSMLDAYYMPFSHSLIAAFIWSGIAFAVYKAARRPRASYSAASLVALAVFSHWILDLDRSSSRSRALRRRLEGGTWPVELPRSRIWARGRVTCRRGHALSDTKCDITKPQESGDWLWNRFDCGPGR
jgi:hypothetical protein